ncbi:putative quinol monooxygenase [Kitasatospora azatica]|uniref:putative quinol monooxygenase n=1 Tax=Kitasatospora azatica TaxID=58347 RepID=UPI0005624871|nr:putative quinol monooxygenase [Kitasatospora azatica]
MSERVSVVVTLKVKPGAEDQFRAQAAATEKVSRAEAGCLSYTNFVDPNDPASWVVVEEWADRAALDTHLNSPHLAESLALTVELLAEPPVLKILSEIE